MTDQTKVIIEVDDPAIKKDHDHYDECRAKYPQTVAEFERLQNEQLKIFSKKMLNYGPGNISVGTSLNTEEEIKLSQTGIWFRINDKVQRLKEMIIFNSEDAVGESIEDSFDDMSVYGIIAQIVRNGKWGK